MIEKTVKKEIKRLIRLSYQTYRLFGLWILLKEMIRYIIHGPILIDTNQQNEYNLSNTVEYTEKQLSEILNELTLKPLISIITPVYNISPEYLNLCIESVISQHYKNWELCLYDDCSTNEETQKCLQEWGTKDPRIKVRFGERNKHISLASNEAIRMSTGEYVSFLDHDDELLPISLLEVAIAINNAPDVGCFYSDEDNISQNGEYFNPHFKSDFNRTLILAHNYITHFVTIKRELGDSLGWFREGYEGSQDHDLILRIMDKTHNIVHIPKILYHWRQSENSTSLNYLEKSYAGDATRKALADYAFRNGFNAEILDGPGLGVYRLKREITTNKLVSIIVPFKDQVDLLKDCVSSVLNNTTYHNFELLLISNNSEKAETHEYLKYLIKKDNRVRVLEHNVPFNFSEINNWAVEQANGDFILLLNNDMKVINSDWLEAMLEHAQQDNVGAVGAKLLYPDNTVQHAGVIIGIQGVAGHSHKYFHDKSVGYFYRVAVAQNISAVTGACLLTKKEIWKEVGGLDEENLKIAFNDIDLCLKIRKAGYEIIYTPYSRLYHYESKSRGAEDTPEKQERFIKECRTMLERWGTNQIPDPFYNVNLTLSSENFKPR